MSARARRSRASACAVATMAIALLATGCDLLPGGVGVPGADAPPAIDNPVIEVGEARSELIARLGEPSDRQEWVKQDEGVFGPIESFWGEVPLGATVEIWQFPVEGGSLEAYFVDGSETVQGTAFAPDGVVY